MSIVGGAGAVTEGVAESACIGSGGTGGIELSTSRGPVGVEASEDDEVPKGSGIDGVVVTGVRMFGRRGDGKPNLPDGGVFGPCSRSTSSNISCCCFHLGHLLPLEHR